MTPENSPNLTVVIPTHNRAPLLRQAIESVLRSPLIASPTQVIVVDDCSTDETPSVIFQAGVRTVRVASGSPSGSRNAGLAMVDTEFVAFLDDDDVWLRGNMEPQLEALRLNPAAAFAFGRVQRTDDQLLAVGPPFPPMPSAGTNLHLFVYAHQLQLGSIALRTAYVKSVGAFDLSLRFGEDSHLLTRLAAVYPVMPVDMVGSLFRQRSLTKREAEDRWRSHRLWGESVTKLRRLGALPPWRGRIGADIRLRGLTNYYHKMDAQAALADGRKRDALRYLWFAWRVSPLHSAIKTSYWSTLRRALSARRGGP